MKPKTIVQTGRVFALALLTTLLLALTVQQAGAQTTGKETKPKTEKPKDFDDVLEQLQKAEADLQRALKEVDWKSIEQEIKTSMQQAKEDIAKAQADLQKNLREIDTEKIKAEMDKALQDAKSVDMKKMKEELDAALAKIDTEKIKQELDKLKEVDLEKVTAELEKVKPELEASMQKAKEGMEKAKAELKAHQVFVNTLAEEGLISKEAYTIEITDDRLLINGKEQPQNVYNKHRAYLEKNKGTVIKKSDTDFSIQKK